MSGQGADRGTGGGRENAVSRVDHISILVENVDSAMEFYVDLLGLEVVKVENSELHGVRAAFLRAGDVMVELIEPLGPGPLQNLLEKRGPGFHHVAFEVPDLERALSDVATAGVRVIDEKPKPGVEGGRISFLHPKSTQGSMIELCDKKEFEEP
ncbi:MAG: methylmalonyl-CoA epimerase [Candidatus Eisenbacteria bacterium]